jgi:inhibitor of cysteine peptidase
MIRTVVLALALLAACAPNQGNAPEQESAAPGVVAAPTPQDVAVRITAEQNGQTVQVPVNQRFAVELVGVPTAGYVWAPTALPPFLTRAGEASGNTVAAQSQPGYTGGNHWEVFMFAATNPGTGELVFEQRRPWESNEPASQSFRVTIRAQ